MNGINKVIMIGNLGHKPELRHTNDKKSVCSFSMAVNHKNDVPLWIYVVCWEKTAESVAKYLDKGSSVYVEGRLQMRKYTKDGVEKERWEIVAHQVLFLDDKKRERGGDDRREEHRDDERDGNREGGGNLPDWA